MVWDIHLSVGYLLNTLIQSQIFTTLHKEHILHLIIPSYCDPLWLPHGAQHQYLLPIVTDNIPHYLPTACLVHQTCTPGP